MTGFLGQWWDDSGFHKMATAATEVGALSEGIYTAMTTTVVGLSLEL
jgi:biopolymer transport protein ExbB